MRTACKLARPRKHATHGEVLYYIVERRILKQFLFQSIGLAVVMLASLSGYLTVLYWRGHAGKDHRTDIWLDHEIPFQPGWVWVYLIPYLIGPVVIGFMQRDTFWWYVRRGLVIVGVTLLIFIAYPTQTAPRPEVELGDGPTSQLYKQMAAVDEPPANAAPSLHVSLTCLLAFALFRDFPRWWLITVVSVLLVWAATLFTKQHHLVDVFTGVLMAAVVVLAFRVVEMYRAPTG